MRSGRGLRRGLPWFEIALSLVLFSAVLYAALSDAYNLPNRWFIRDDAYYYYKVAQNIAEGHGSSFDGIHPTNGYHPLWLLLCIPIFSLARYDLILPLRLLAILIGLLQIGAALLIYRLVRRSISEMAAVIAACFWAFNSYVLVFLYKTGVESSITVFLVLLLLSQLRELELSWRSRQPSVQQVAGLGVLATLIAFGRLDLIFFSLIIGIWVVFRGSPLRYFLPLDILALVVAVIAAFLTRLGFATYYDVSASVITMLVASLLCKVPILYVMGQYGAPGAWKPGPGLVRLLLACAAGSAVLGVILFGGGAAGLLPVFSRAVLLLDGIFAFGLLAIIRLGAWLFRSEPAVHASPSPLDHLRASWRRWISEGAVFYGIVGGALGAYMLWNRLAFGTFTPVSGQIKHWWGSFTHSIYGTAASSWLTFFALNPFSDFNAWAPPLTTLSDWSNSLLYDEGTRFGNPQWQINFAMVLLAVAILILGIAMLRKRAAVRATVQSAMIPLFVGSWLQIIAYNATGYASAKEWYWLLQPVLLVLVGAVLVRILGDVVTRRWAVARFAIWAAVAWYAVQGAYAYWRDAYALSPYGLHVATTPYSPIIPFLEAQTEPGALIGMTGGGNVGYLMPGRTIVNMDGLINSYDYFQALQTGTGADYLYETGLRYVFANPALLEANPYKGQFTGRLELVMEWGGKDLLRLLPKGSE